MSARPSTRFSFGIRSLYLTSHAGVLSEQPDGNVNSAVLSFNGTEEMAIFTISEQILENNLEAAGNWIEADSIQSIPAGGSHEQ